MEKFISAAAARRNFSESLNGVEKGNMYVVMRRGSPAAHIVQVLPAVGERFRAALIERLRSQPIKKIGKWKRDNLYR